MRHGEGSISGAVSLFELENFHIQKAILSAGGITPEHGISDYNIEEVLVRKKVIEQACEVILVADSSKFGRDVPVHITPLSSIDTIITDNKIYPELLEKFREADANIVLA